MSAPVKPWERSAGCCPSTGVNSMSAGLAGVESVRQALPPAVVPTAAPTAPTAPPSLPPRPSEQNTGLRGAGLGYNSNYNSFGGYGSYGGIGGSYGGYSGYTGMGGYSSPYSSLGGYGGYGGYSGYNRMGGALGHNGADGVSSFARQAEESSRPAFESIESIVSAVNSVGMMLDSTFGAVYNSFRAVIGVADNFSRLKTQLVQVFSALAFIRTLRYLFKRLLELLRLAPQGEAQRQWTRAFNEAADLAHGGPGGGGPKKSSWPIMMFFGIIMGGPYLIWKLISAFSASDESPAGWSSGKDDHFLARAEYDFTGGQSSDLAFKRGDQLYVAPKELQPRVRGWLLASSGSKTGMIPANYVTVLGRRRGTDTTSPAHALPSNPTPTTANVDLSQAYDSLKPSTTTATTKTPLSQTSPVPAPSDFDAMFNTQSATCDSVSPSMNTSFQPSVSNASNSSKPLSSQELASDILSDLDTVR